MAAATSGGKTTYLEEDEPGEHECGHDVTSSEVAHGRRQGGVQRVVNEVGGQGARNHGDGFCCQP